LLAATGAPRVSLFFFQFTIETIAHELSVIRCLAQFCFRAIVRHHQAVVVVEELQLFFVFGFKHDANTQRRVFRPSAFPAKHAFKRVHSFCFAHLAKHMNNEVRIARKA